MLYVGASFRLDELVNAPGELSTNLSIDFVLPIDILEGLSLSNLSAPVNYEEVCTIDHGSMTHLILNHCAAV